MLEQLNSLVDLKKMNLSELNILSEDIRKALMNRISSCGGHFGPNFGFVEASIALHYVFNSPVDKFVFDVSHQCYVHKILTGRKEAFLDKDKFQSISGYTNPQESEHDVFNVGHTSTSVSLACGLAKARDLIGGKENVVAIIGDGSLSGGEAFEGLDLAAELGGNLIVLVNDNGMSIAEDHGGLYSNLKLLRDTNGEADCNFFKALGFEYTFVKDGNDLETLITAFTKVKDINHPIVVHICTVKGMGYPPALEDKENYHWKPMFYPETGENKNKMNGENYDNIVCDYLLEKMKRDKSVATVVAAVPLTLGFNAAKRKEAGKQFIDVGIAEQTAVSLCAGIAKRGGKVVMGTFSSFYQRAYDQISQDICINKLPVTLLVRNGSVWADNNVTHLGFFDIPLLSNIPNLVYLSPTNKEEYMAMLDWSIEQKEHPVAIRIPRNGVHHTDEAVDTDYSALNKYKMTKQGSKVAIIALGDFYQMGEEVVAKLKDECNIATSLINPRYISGIDVEMLKALQEDHNLVVTLEDGILSGGFGEKIASFYGTSCTKVMSFGLKKKFADRFVLKELLQENHLTTEQIVEDIKKQLL